MARCRLEPRRDKWEPNRGGARMSTVRECRNRAPEMCAQQWLAVLGGAAGSLGSIINASEHLHPDRQAVKLQSNASQAPLHRGNCHVSDLPCRSSCRPARVGSGLPARRPRSSPCHGTRSPDTDPGFRSVDGERLGVARRRWRTFRIRGSGRVAEAVPSRPPTTGTDRVMLDSNLIIDAARPEHTDPSSTWNFCCEGETKWSCTATRSCDW
jgi:hypothetical protein